MSMARLSEDLIVDVLTRLPVKPLMRFKCVSKQWCSLISAPQFAKTQLRRAREGNATSHQRIIKNGFLQTIHYEALDDERDDDQAVVQLHAPGTDPDQGFMLIGHCDGLMCLACDEGYILYNPTTRQSRSLANSESGPVTQDFVFHGFGYYPTIDDYKILQGKIVSCADGSKEAAMEIFALKSNSWRRIQNSRVIDPYDRGIYLNGALHWLVFPEIGSNRVRKIVSFDLAEEKFKEELSLPETDKTIEFEGLGIFGDRLFLYCGTWCDRLEAWIMNEYGKTESWTELFNVPTDGIPGAKYWTIPLCCTKNGKIVVDVDGREMVLFNPEDGTIKPYPVEDADYESAIYVESLVSPYVGA
ncbi:F-box/kelch-repeat protein At3g06240-like isoform X2 [Punica granatum]|nr:F-box/kelch-repeat protein At3g06240-like isoform X2 [Punica granatum]